MTRFRWKSVLTWPLPAFFAWAASWMVFKSLLPIAAPWLALLLGTLVGTIASLCGDRWWRRGMIAAGFPLSLGMVGAVGLPAWAWLLPLLLLLLVYPLNAWRDAPVFPTPAAALESLPVHVSLEDGSWVLDAGCGLGDGLQALRRAYPHVRLHGLEWSWPLRLICAWRCPWAKVRRADIWETDWGAYRMVYLFQRPESMTRAALKAEGEMSEGGWLVSLDFPVADAQPVATGEAAGHQWYAYQLPLWPQSQQTVHEAMAAPQLSKDEIAWQSIYPRRHPPRIKTRPVEETQRKRLWGRDK